MNNSIICEQTCGFYLNNKTFDIYYSLDYCFEISMISEILVLTIILE